MLIAGIGPNSGKLRQQRRARRRHQFDVTFDDCVGIPVSNSSVRHRHGKTAMRYLNKSRP